MKIQAIKPEPKRIATSIGKPDQPIRDTKETLGNTPLFKPSKSATKKLIIRLQKFTCHS